MNFKLVASQAAGKYQVGSEITDADEIAATLAGPLRKRFVKVPLDAGEIPHAPAEDAPAPSET